MILALLLLGSTALAPVAEEQVISTDFACKFLRQDGTSAALEGNVVIDPQVPDMGYLNHVQLSVQKDETGLFRRASIEASGFIREDGSVSILASLKTLQEAVPQVALLSVELPKGSGLTGLGHIDIHRPGSISSANNASGWVVPETKVAGLCSITGQKIVSSEK